MEGLDIVQLITTWGWKAVVIAFAAFFLIEVFKPLIRKMIKNEQGRHAFYSIIDLVLVAAGCYAWMAIQSMSWGIDWAGFGTMFTAAYGALKIIYPIYSNLGIQAAIRSLFASIFKRKKEVADEVKKQEAEKAKAEEKKVIEL